MVDAKLADMKIELEKSKFHKSILDKKLTAKDKQGFLMLAIQTKVKKMNSERMEKVKKEHQD